MLKIKHLCKTYHNKSGDVTALLDIDLTIDNTGLYVILGPSGSGKSTLMQIIAGVDKDYSGDIDCKDKVIYMKQDIHLFDDMPLIDNIKLITDDKKIIDPLLKHFDLDKHIKKKVKKLSNGQKKRLELLICVLLKPDILLLDEPTSALDRDNANKIMRLLDGLSNVMTIIMVTHDIALAYDHAYKVIEIEDGKIEKIIAMNDSDNKRITHQRKGKRKLKDHFGLALKELYSRLPYQLGYMVLLMVVSFFLIILINIFLSINSERDYTEVFKNGENIIESLPDNKVMNDRDSELGFDDIYGSYAERVASGISYHFKDYDKIKATDIKRSIQDDPNILAVNAFYDPLYRDDDQIIDEITTYYESSEDKAFYPLTHYDNDIVKIPEYKNTEYNKIYHELFITDIDKYIEVIKSGVLKADSGIDLERDARQNEVHIFTLVNTDEDLPIIMGTLPQTSDELLIDDNFAQILMKVYGIDNRKELVGKEIDVSSFSGFSKVKELSFVFSMPNDTDIDIMTYIEENEAEGRDMSAMRNYLTNAQTSLDSGNYDYNDFLPFESFQYKIVGISSIENDDMAMGFCGGELFEGELWDYYIMDKEDLEFEYAEYILKPNTDYDASLTKLKNDLTLTGNDLYFQNEIIDDIVYSYEDITSLIPYLLAILIISLFVLIIYRISDIKRIKKENFIFKRADYCRYKEVIIRISIIGIIVIALILVISYPLFDLINEVASGYNYMDLIVYSPSLIVIMTLSVIVFAMVLELVLTKVKAS